MKEFIQYYEEIPNEHWGVHSRKLTKKECLKVEKEIEQQNVLFDKIQSLRNQIYQVEEQISTLRKNSNYKNVFIDKGGFPYDIRKYVITGKNTLV